MNGGRRSCPVCWQSVVPTTKDTVYRHWDSVGNTICPMSGEPYEMAQSRRRVTVGPKPKKEAA